MTSSQMRWPKGLTEVTFRFGPDVYVTLRGEYGSWEVWDERPVRQGARQVGNFLSRREAFDRARNVAMMYYDGLRYISAGDK